LPSVSVGHGWNSRQKKTIGAANGKWPKGGARISRSRRAAICFCWLIPEYAVGVRFRPNFIHWRGGAASIWGRPLGLISSPRLPRHAEFPSFGPEYSLGPPPRSHGNNLEMSRPDRPGPTGPDCHLDAQRQKPLFPLLMALDPSPVRAPARSRGNHEGDARPAAGPAMLVV